tara:strand:- start:21159 stop:22991 length:1833 start_codon:yes stop_codon:yes gene_type:complete
MNYHHRVIIVDGEYNLSEIKGEIYLWSGYKSQNNSKSLLKMLDDSSEKIRESYLKSHRKIIQQIYLQIEKNTNNLEIIRNLFWSSLTIENSHFKSPRLLDVLRLIVLENEIEKIDCKELIYIGSDKILLKSIELICKKKKISFSTKRIFLFRKNILNIFLNKTQNVLKSILFLIVYSLKNWKLRKIRSPKWYSDLNSIFLFSYLIHLDEKKIQNGSFYSKHWEVLPEFLRGLNKKINWMHIYSKNSMIPNNDSAINYIKIFNSNKKDDDNHALFNSYLNIDIIFKTFKNYIYVYFSTFLLTRKLNRTFNKSPIWNLIKNDWSNSITGTYGMQNIIWINLFDKAMGSIPYQKTGLYLCENQGWERIFINFWKKHNHGKLIGFAHSTISYWDMRYFDNLERKYKKPKPDIIAINGPNAWNTLASIGNDMKQYKKVEALRYLYLKNLNQNNNTEVFPPRIKILILGDIIPKTTFNMLALINESSKLINSLYQLTFKPHPGNQIKLDKFSKIKIDITLKPLDQILFNNDIVISSVFTSASLDAYCSGVQIINYLDPYSLNYSILKGQNDVSFVSSTQELNQELIKYKKEIKNKNIAKDYFWLDESLPMWKKLFI